jgi:hypothetical protein
MEPYHRLRIVDKLILLVMLSALLFSLSLLSLAGQNIWGNYLFATTAMVHGVAIISLVRKRGEIYDETL